MCLTTLPPRICWIEKREFGDNWASASRESPSFDKSLIKKELFSRA